MSLPRYIIGVDPGKRTGVAVFDLLFEKCASEEFMFHECAAWLERKIAELRPDVAAEAFIINAGTVRNTQAPWSLKMLGVTEAIAFKYGCVYTEQAQSSAKRFATDERLKKLGWWEPRKGHAMDAKRQILLYLVSHQWWHDALNDGTIDADVSEGGM